MTMKPTVKLLHAADLHLGAKFVALGAKGAAQRQRLREAFLDLIQAALDENVAAVLLAGDTFDQTMPSRESQAVFALGVEKLAARKIPLLMIAGTHDHLEPNAFWGRLAQEQAGRVFLLTEEHPCWESPDRGLRVQGVSLLTSERPENPLCGLRRVPGPLWQVGMAHGALDLGRQAGREACFTPDDIAATGLDYLALGHWHNMLDCSRGPVTAWYAGAPEMIALDETCSGSILIVTLQDGRPVQVDPRRIGKRKLLAIDLEAGPTPDLLERLQELADPEAVLLLNLTGMAKPDLNWDPEEIKAGLASCFFHIRIQDHTYPELAPQDLERFPETTLLGRYIRLLQAELAGADADRRRDLVLAQQLGCALLLGHEVKRWF